MPGLLEFNTLNRGKIPNEVHQPLQKLVAPHVDSFDFFMNQALPGCVSVWFGVVRGERKISSYIYESISNTFMHAHLGSWQEGGGR